MCDYPADARSNQASNATLSQLSARCAAESLHPSRRHMPDRRVFHPHQSYFNSCLVNTHLPTTASDRPQESPQKVAFLIRRRQRVSLSESSSQPHPQQIAVPYLHHKHTRKYTHTHPAKKNAMMIYL